MRVLQIGDGEGEEYSEVLVSGAYLPCRHGGIIEVVEVPEEIGEKQSEKILPLESKWLKEHTEGMDYIEYVTMEFLEELGWFEIADYFIDKKTGERSDWQDTFQSDGTFDPDPEIEAHHRPLDEQDVINLNRVLSYYNITNRKRVAAFMAEISYECGCGYKMCEKVGTEEHPFNEPTTRTNMKNWYDTYSNYPYQYRGGGAIQLTHDYNYECVQEEIGDSNIVLIGTEYIAYNYPWLSVGAYWKENELNSAADEGIDAVTKK